MLPVLRLGRKFKQSPSTIRVEYKQQCCCENTHVFQTSLVKVLYRRVESLARTKDTHSIYRLSNRQTRYGWNL